MEGGIEFGGGAAETADGEAFGDGVAGEVVADVTGYTSDEDEHFYGWDGDMLKC